MAAQAQTAILECISGAQVEGRMRLIFRVPGAGLPKVERATLFLHLDSDPPPKPMKLNGRHAAPAAQEKGWMAVTVPVKEALKPIRLETGGAVFHSCSDRDNAPYLVVEQTSTPRGRQDQ